MERLRQFIQDTAGNATEYILIAMVVSLAIIAGGSLLGMALAGMFDQVNGAFPK